MTTLTGTFTGRLSGDATSEPITGTFSMNFSQAGIVSELDGIKAAYDGGSLSLYGGQAFPATPETALTGTKLITFSFATPAFGADLPVSGQTMTTATFLFGNVAPLASGTAVFARAVKADGTTALSDHLVAAVWRPSSDVTVNQSVVSAGNVYLCMTAGKTASSGGPSGTGASITDGGAVWRYTAPASANVLVFGSTSVTRGVPSTMTAFTLSTGAPLLETLTIATPAPTLTGVAVPLSGSYTNGPPAALDYSLEGTTWLPVTSFAEAGTAVQSLPKILLPAYFYPGALWTQVDATMPSVGGYVIMDPTTSGPGSTVDPNYVSAVGAAKAAGLNVIGYIDTQFGARSAALIKTDVDNYKAWYGVSSIFLDQVATTVDHLAYYQDLANYVHQTAGTIVVLNHGTIPDQSYASVGDILVIFESAYSAYLTWQPPIWVSNYPPSKFAHIAYNVPDQPAMINAISLAVARNAGFVYFNDNVLYNTLPPYWSQELSALIPFSGPISSSTWTGIGPTLTVANPAQVITVRDHDRPSVSAQSGPFAVTAPAPVETLTITTPVGAVAGTPVAMSGAWTVVQPTLFEYSISGGSSWNSCSGPATVVSPSGTWQTTGPNFGAARTGIVLIVRDRLHPTIQATTGAFDIAAPAQSPETLTIVTPTSVRTGTPLALSGTYTSGPPTALDYSNDGTTWFPLGAPVVIGANSWSGTGPTFQGAVASQTVRIRDRVNTTITAVSGSFAVTSPPVETLAVVTPTSAFTNTPLALNGSYTNGPPTAFDYSTDGGTTWLAMIVQSIGGGLWSATGPTYTSVTAGVQVLVRDHNVPTVSAITDPFAVTLRTGAALMTDAEGHVMTDTEAPSPDQMVGP